MWDLLILPSELNAAYLYAQLEVAEQINKKEAIYRTGVL